MAERVMCDGILRRSARKDDKRRDEQRQQLGLPEAVRLLPESAADAEVAALVPFGSPAGFANSARHKRQAIRAESIFAPDATTAAAKRRQQNGAVVGSLQRVQSGGVRKQKGSTLDKAALLLKRRRMDAGLKLGLLAPGTNA